MTNEPQRTSAGRLPSPKPSLRREDREEAPATQAIQSPLTLKAPAEESEKGNVIDRQGFIGYHSENAVCNNGTRSCSLPTLNDGVACY